MTAAGWTRLGDLVRQQRNLNQMSQAQYARKIGIGRGTLSKIENGHGGDFDKDTRDRVDVAMSWRFGSFDAVADGGEPEYGLDATFRELAQRWRDLPPRLQGCVLALVRGLTDE